MSPFLTDEVSPEVSPELSPSLSQGKTYSPQEATLLTLLKVPPGELDLLQVPLEDTQHKRKFVGMNSDSDLFLCPRTGERDLYFTRPYE